MVDSSPRASFQGMTSENNSRRESITVPLAAIPRHNKRAPSPQLNVDCASYASENLGSPGLAKYDSAVMGYGSARNNAALPSTDREQGSLDTTTTTTTTNDDGYDGENEAANLDRRAGPHIGTGTSKVEAQQTTSRQRYEIRLRSGEQTNRFKNKMSSSLDGSRDLLNVERFAELSDEMLQDAKTISDVLLTSVDPNHIYQQCFRLLRIGGLEAEIPRLVVFGQQSMGKTTLLDYIMGGPIGFSSTDTGTKQPVVIVLKPKESGSDGIECRLRNEPVDVRDLHDTMKDIMQSSCGISGEELDLEISIPGGVHAVFVDLPGIKDDSKTGAELTRSVVRNYVSNNPNDLYILVKKASDDPANWPWTLRQFILSAPPLGLGLTPRQAIVVGTRALDFLAAERTDIKTIEQLAQRVQKRSICDCNGEPLPLFLLELFSLSIEEKESLDFLARKLAMEQQVLNGKRSCAQLLAQSFHSTSDTSLLKLAKVFDVDLFKKELNVKFQALLSQQLGLLEGRLVHQRTILQQQYNTIEQQLEELSGQSVREHMRLFFRELIGAVTELMSGNYMVMQLPDHGEAFLKRFGGTLLDNLVDGHCLAMELFPDQRHYDPGFLDRVLELGKLIFEKEIKERKAKRNSMYPVACDAATKVRSLPEPDPSGRLLPGQFVRYKLPKDNTQMLGHVHSMRDGDSSKGSVVQVSFQFITEGSIEPQMQPREVDRDRLVTLVPLSLVISPRCIPPRNYRCWRKTQRADNWIGVTPVALRSVSMSTLHRTSSGDPYLDEQREADEQRELRVGLTRVTGPIRDAVKSIPMIVRPQQQSIPVISRPQQQSTSLFDCSSRVGKGVESAEASESQDATPSGHYTSVPGFAVYLPTGDEESDTVLGILGQEHLASTCSFDELFCESSLLLGDPPNIFDYIGGDLSPLHKIAGDFADTKLLNELSLTYIGRWLKFHVNNLEPTKRFPNHVLLQMMRSVRNVVDKADWEPVVSDLVQSNISGDFLYLIRLASCATSVAVQRIIRAAIHEVVSQVRSGCLANSLQFLAGNPKFLSEIEGALDEYCRVRAGNCASAMRELIFEQTHVTHFELIQDFFNGCRRFEKNFLGSEQMSEVTSNIYAGLAERKMVLNGSEIHSRQLTGVSNDMIYDQVRVQFWVLKTLLAAPLCTKLYVYFVKDIKDRRNHLAEDTRMVSMENPLEKALQKYILHGRSMEDPSKNKLRSDDELCAYFNLAINREELKARFDGVTRALEYVSIVMRSITKARFQMFRGRGVDFLMRLGQISW